VTIQIEELNDTNCKTYLLSAAGRAALIDPVRERVEDYRRVLHQRGLDLAMIVETHTHADHLMFNRAIKESFGVPYLMHRASPSPLVDRHLAHGDTIDLAGQSIRVLHTPGHTPDSIALVMDGAVLTGDTLLIGGSGRTDFPGGDAGAQYDAVTGLLFALPDDTVVWPGHDYRGNTSTTIGDQKRANPRLAGTSRDQYVDLMANLGLPFPQKIQQALQVNQSGLETHEILFPPVADIAAVPQINPTDLAGKLEDERAPVVVDVREPEEFVGELGHIEGALPIPLDSLQKRLPKLTGYVDRDLVVVCRAGARSASACAMLVQAGFPRVANLEGGMLAWVEAGMPVQR
jgi:sulfur dioxygenase